MHLTLSVGGPGSAEDSEEPGRERRNVELLTRWDTFYAIVGGAAATLTGLMFIAVTLVAQGQRRPGSPDAVGAFSTPTIVHFSTVLGLAALLAAPWRALWPPGLLLGLAGLAGVLYMPIVARRTRRQIAYTPVLEDQIWHLAFPLLAYGALILAALVWPADATLALFVAGAALALLLFVGIHNAWDNVTYLVLHPASPDQEERAGSAPEREER